MGIYKLYILGYTGDILHGHGHFRWRFVILIFLGVLRMGDRDGIEIGLKFLDISKSGRHPTYQAI